MPRSCSDWCVFSHQPSGFATRGRSILKSPETPGGTSPMDRGRARRFLKALLLLCLPAVFLSVDVDGLSDVPYVWLTGYTHHELEELSYMDQSRLEARTGLAEVPGGYDRDRSYRGRAAHAIASYLGTRRWGPDVTLAFG